MLRFEDKATVLKDSFDKEESGWLPISLRAKEFKDMVGKDVFVYVLVDEEKIHDPKPMRTFKVSHMGGIGYKVNEHEIMGRHWTCDCEFYLHTNGETLCPHMIEVMKQLIKTKRWDLK